MLSFRSSRVLGICAFACLLPLSRLFLAGRQLEEALVVNELTALEREMGSLNLEPVEGIHGLYRTKRKQEPVNLKFVPVEKNRTERKQEPVNLKFVPVENSEVGSTKKDFTSAKPLNDDKNLSKMEHELQPDTIAKTGAVSAKGKELPKAMPMIVKTDSSRKKDLRKRQKVELKQQKNHIEHSKPNPKQPRWKDGCQYWSRTDFKSKKTPTGIVVTLMLGVTITLEAMCDALTLQRVHFIDPQGLDQLLISDGYPLEELLTDCFGLFDRPTLETWTNLDGSTLTTWKFVTSAKNRLYVGYTKVQFPSRFQDDPTLLYPHMEPPYCQSSLGYVQGTRWYSNELLHLSLVSRYDYVLKIDSDVVFRETVPFHLLYDLNKKRGLFAHTAQYTGGDGTCAFGIRNAVAKFSTSLLNSTESSTSWQKHWKRGLCSSNRIVTEIDADLYYTNFVVLRTNFWQSEPVLEFARYLSNVDPGFFRYRWTDQIFFHHAMGLFLGPDFTDHVVDYTPLRCASSTTCWTARNEWSCTNGGYFDHGKNAIVWRQMVLNMTNAPPTRKVRKTIYNVTYQEKCY